MYNANIISVFWLTELIRVRDFNWTSTRMTLSWYRPVSIEITNITIIYNIIGDTGSIALLNNDSNLIQYWTYSLMEGSNKYDYSISLAAGVYVNGSVVQGNFTNLNGSALSLSLVMQFCCYRLSW